MMKSVLSVMGCLVSGSVLAASPLYLSDNQMDMVTGGSFVCPVIQTDNVLHSDNGGTLGPIDGEGGEVYYTIGGPDVSDAVPMGATNDDGAGVPMGPYTAPGDTTYTAIWYQ